jgi:hypothetical protein
MTIEPPHRMPTPRTLVLAFMAGLAIAARRLGSMYVEELFATLAIVRPEGRA